ncbi:hypothetical protein [Microbulbifer rhizosphaerae]|uniref:ElaB/YqjD/DUF883 family membrane-anchored ribosome-binding protein n=1 Tax=Microbulbifer rhizosphaerae TaxID=1562603 RepID=A0A7W4ZAQ5_9GAMM|nr:hypothetical protein [Microbulbifer rhizosphaerae]MBB3062801.1 ElaB/YqjD/DUF883 family membrane-anchored ribosome-binding protein [Microbulbifer rhizosphaerae]
MATAKPLNSGRDKLRQASHLAGEAATDTAAQLRERAMSSVQTSKQRAAELEKKWESSVKRHPVLSVGGAFVAGWVIAKLFK